MNIFKVFKNNNLPQRDDSIERSIFRHRLIFAGVFMLILGVVLFANLYYLQVVNYNKYLTRSDNNRIKVNSLVPSRGLIYDRNKILLAENKPLFSLEIIPELTQTLEADIIGLKNLLNLDLEEADIKEILERTKFNPKYISQTVAVNLSEEQVATFAVNQYKFNAARIEPTLKRFYPFNDSLTHAIGYVSRINSQDLKKLSEEGKGDNYLATNDIGKQGIEKYYERLLHGQMGYKEVEVDSHGRALRTLNIFSPQPGRNLILTLDIRLQLKAEELLKGKRGSMIMLDPRTGEILAFVSSPSYNPNYFVRGIKNSEYKELLNNSNRPLINRVTQGNYSPASTVKPLLLIMGLNEEFINSSTRFFGSKFFKIPGSEHKFRDWRPWGHGWMDIYRAVEISADTFFYDLAYRAGIDRIHEYMTKFGFGVPSGIDIYEESLGNMPSKSWKKKRYKRDWFPGDTVSVGIGQGYWNTNLIQIARAHSILTQNGKNIIPHFLKVAESLNDEANIYFPIPKEQVLTLKDNRYWDYAKEGMCLVINGPEGTARRAFANTKYRACGKSGTAQLVAVKQDAKYNASALKEVHRDNGLFVAFAPEKEPEVLVAAIVENLGGGSSVVAPLVRQLMDEYYKNKNSDPNNIDVEALIEKSKLNHMEVTENE